MNADLAEWPNNLPRKMTVIIYLPRPHLLQANRFYQTFARSQKGPPDGCKLMILDIKKAFRYSGPEDQIYIELPDEDPGENYGMVGKLLKAMYRTRSAPQAWHNLVRETFSSLGFVPSNAVPSLFFHQERDIRVCTHVDDFVCSGENSEIT